MVLSMFMMSLSVIRSIMTFLMQIWHCSWCLCHDNLT